MRFVFEICSGSYSLWQEKHVVIMAQSIFTPFPRQKWRCFCCEKNYTLYYCCNPLGEEFPWAKMPLPTAASFFYLAQAKAFPCDSLCPAFCWFDCLLTFLQYTSILSFISGVWKEPFFCSKRLLLLCCCTTQYKIKQTEFQLAIGRWHLAFFPPFISSVEAARIYRRRSVVVLPSAVSHILLNCWEVCCFRYCQLSILVDASLSGSRKATQLFLWQKRLKITAQKNPIK